MADKFDRFTKESRNVLTFAHEEAVRFNHNYIGTEHLLLGLIREEDSVAARVLSSLGIRLQKVRSAVKFIIGRGDQATAGSIGLTPRAKKVIELANDEADQLNHYSIGTEHLLLGLVREGEGIAAGVLESLGVSLEKVRAQVIRAIDFGNIASTLSSSAAELRTPKRPDASASGERLNPFTKGAKRSLTLAEEEARRFNRPAIGTEHLLLGFIREGDGVAARVLKDKGVSLADARRAVKLRNPGDSENITGELYLSQELERVLDLAVEQAKRLNGRAIETEHLLLGLIRRIKSTAVLVMSDLGVDPIDVRSELIRSIDRASSVEGGSSFATEPWAELDVFDRFTARARAILAHAESEAHRTFLVSVGTEHLLLGIVQDEDCIAAQILANLGSPPPKVRSAMELIMSREDPTPMGEPGPTSRARAALVFAADEARRLNQDNIDTEHVLLGLIREGEGIAAAVLEVLGVSLELAREDARLITG